VLALLLKTLSMQPGNKEKRTLSCLIIPAEADN